VEEYPALILNGQMIDLVGGLDRRLEAGDHLLLPGFSGGERGDVGSLERSGSPLGLRRLTPGPSAPMRQRILASSGRGDTLTQF
jgi:hypothetical protein